MIHFLYLGRVDYETALGLQEELVRLRTANRIGNVLLLLEHPPVLTLGRNANRANILASDALLAARGVTLHAINRGGDVTYHGPGQLVGYPIFDLRSLRNARGARLGPVEFVRQMEEALIRLCGEFGLAAGRIRGLTGVWIGLPPAATDESPSQRPPSSTALPSGPAGSSRCGTFCGPAADDPPMGERKIAAIGIHVARGVTSHGFAFNVATDLDGFQLINPCGITDRPVTSLAREIADPAALPALALMAARAARQFGTVFDEPVEPLESLEALRASARPAAVNHPEEAAATPSAAAPIFPAEDTPIETPAAIERLHGTAARPTRA